MPEVPVCSFFNYGIELIWRAGTFMLDKFKFSHFHPQNWTYWHTHTCALAGVRCLLLAITDAWLTSDEVNSIMGEKSVIFKQKQQQRQEKKLNLSSVESLWVQSKCLNLSGLWTYWTWTFVSLFYQRNRGILAGTWWMFELIRHLNISNFNFSGMGCSCTSERY